MSAKADARLEVIAAVEFAEAGRGPDADWLIRTSENPAELAAAAVGLCEALLRLVPEESRHAVLTGLRAAVIAEDDT